MSDSPREKILARLDPESPEAQRYHRRAIQNADSLGVCYYRDTTEFKRITPIITALLDLCVRQNEALVNMNGNYPGDKPSIGTVFRECVDDMHAAIADYNKTLAELGET